MSTSFSARLAITEMRSFKYCLMVSASSICEAYMNTVRLSSVVYMRPGKPIYQPDPHVGRNLIVPASARVKLASNILANDLRQSTFIGSMDVLVVRFDVELPERAWLSAMHSGEFANEGCRTLPSFHSCSTTRKPLSISACSVSETIPAFCNALENAIEPFTSAANILWS